MARRWNKISAVSCLMVRNLIEKLTTSLLVPVWPLMHYNDHYNDQVATTPWATQTSFEYDDTLISGLVNCPYGTYGTMYQDARPTGVESTVGGNVRGNVGGNVGGNMGRPR